jgi:hypothetical protein
MWHWSRAVQAIGLEPTQVPVALHASVCVHELLSSHAVPLALTGLLQVPLAGSHVPALWQASIALQTTVIGPVHTPDWQVLVAVQALLSEHGVPSAADGLEHAPVAGSHVPALWQASGVAQLIGFAPEQMPFWHVSACVHALASLHAAPLPLGGFEHAPVAESHVPGSWH